jgi:hypothetical protein
MSSVTMKAERLRLALRPLLSNSTNFSSFGQTRSIHKTRAAPTVPPTRPFVPDVQTFLTLIGRGLNKHTSKFPSWESLFALTSPELKELGIEPPRTRRYLLQWMQRYRKGAFGPGGDFEHVKDGQALLKVALPPATKILDRKYVVNIPAAEEQTGELAGELIRPNGYTVRGAKSISGPYAVPLPDNSGATVKVTEGMWEDRRGRKIDGGERRRAEVRFKKRSAERRAEREAEILANL